jgi:AcrR family transcriptional regulator
MERGWPFANRVPTATSKQDKIRDAALARFAQRGVDATSLRDIAAAAGVSIGLVQHHFGTKARLVKAVDDYVIEVIGTGLTGTSEEPSVEVSNVGQRVATLIAEQPLVVDYLGRALVDGHEGGAIIFDALVEMGSARWDERARRELTTEDLDRTWATLNPIILVVGATILRAHIDRHLPEPFTSATQLVRWQDAVNALMRHGMLRPGDRRGEPDDGP